jgi:hypothetical protein
MVGGSNPLRHPTFLMLPSLLFVRIRNQGAAREAGRAKNRRVEIVKK